METRRSVANFAKSLSSDHEKMIKEIFDMGGQEHLFEDWDEWSDENRSRLLNQLKSLDDDYAGGLRAYVENARHLLKSGGTREKQTYRVQVPKGTVLIPGEKVFERAERAGLEIVSECAFVLVAGGRGERLGYDGIKLELPCETTTWKCYLQIYVEHILALQRLTNAKCPIPLAIMTSEATHSDTKRLLKKNQNFGAAPGQIVLMKQKGVASLSDPSARIALDSKDRFRVLTKPHGHGDVHALLLSSGLAQKWSQESRKYVCFFQDTQGYLVFKSLPAVIGTCRLDGASMTTMCVSRRAGDAQGAICTSCLMERTFECHSHYKKITFEYYTNTGTLVNAKDAKDHLTINVEYNLLDRLLRHSNTCDTNDPKTGYSPFPGNTNCFCISLSDYVSNLKRTHGIVPEFVNPKYQDETKTKFKKPTRLECMMQDYPKLLSNKSEVTFCVLPRWFSYSPVKNQMDSAVLRVRRGLSGACVVTGESDTYALHTKQLQMLGVRCDRSKINVVGKFQVPVVMKPNVIWNPNFAPTYTALRTRFPSPRDVYISEDSSLSIELENDSCDLVVKKFELRGALRVVLRNGARVVFDDFMCSNKGWHFENYYEEKKKEEVKKKVRHGQYSGMCLRQVETNVLIVDGECVSWNGRSCPSGVVVVGTTETIFHAFVKSVSSGQIFTIDVRHSDTILDIKKNIQAISGLDVDDQELIYAGKKLQNSRYFCAGPGGVVRRNDSHCGYGMGNNATLLLIQKTLS